MGSTTARTFSYNRPAGAGAERLGSTAPLHVYGTWGDRRDDGIRRIRPGASQPPPVETCAHRRDRVIWRALLPGTAGEAVAQEGFAQLEVALPSSLTHVAMIGVFSERGEHGGQCCDRRGPAQAFGHHRGP